jgi:hypothetical protein
MRFSRFAWAGLALALAPTFVAGCNFSGETPAAQFGYDASYEFPDASFESFDAGPVHDAAPPVHDAAHDAVVADSSVDAAADVTVDAAPDGGADAAADVTVDAAPPGVTVVVTNTSGPEAAVTVVVQDADGGVVTSGVTDVTGTFSQAPVVAGSQVTVVMGSAASPVLVTVQGVEPGDVIPIVDPTSPASSEVVSIDTLPPDPPDGSTDFYGLIGSCGGNYVPESVDLGMLVGFTPCASHGTFPVLIQSSSGSSAYTFQKNNLFAPDDAGITHVFPAGGWQTDEPFVPVGVSNWPSGMVTGGSIGLEQVANGVALPSFYNEGTYAPEGDPEFLLYPGYADFLQSEGSLYVDLPDGGVAFSVMATRAAPDAGPPGLDFSQVLPFIDSVSVYAADPSRPAVTWQADAGGLAAVDGTVAAVTWQDVGPNESYVYGTWVVFGPPAATTLTLPALPSDVASWAPSDSATLGSPTPVGLIDATFLSGYADLRANIDALTPLGNLASGTIYGYPILPPLPVEGTLRLTAITVLSD